MEKIRAEREFLVMMYANENGYRFGSGYQGKIVGLFFIIMPRLILLCFSLLSSLFFQGFVNVV